MRKALSAAVALTFVLFGLSGPAPIARAVSPTTVVTIGFDDGYADQFQAMQILGGHGLHATFFINSGFVGTDGRLTWDEIRPRDVIRIDLDDDDDDEADQVDDDSDDADD